MKEVTGRSNSVNQDKINHFSQCNGQDVLAVTVQLYNPIVVTCALPLPFPPCVLFFCDKEYVYCVVKAMITTHIDMSKRALNSSVWVPVTVATYRQSKTLS